MVKKISKGSLLGRSSSGSKDKTGLYLVMIVAIVAVVALFLMVKGGAQTSSEEVMVVDEAGNLVGEAFYGEAGSKLKNVESKKIKGYDIFKDEGGDDDAPEPPEPEPEIPCCRMSDGAGNTAWVCDCSCYPGC